MSLARARPILASRARLPVFSSLLPPRSLHSLSRTLPSSLRLSFSHRRTLSPRFVARYASSFRGGYSCAANAIDASGTSHVCIGYVCLMHRLISIFRRERGSSTRRELLYYARRRGNCLVHYVEEPIRRIISILAGGERKAIRLESVRRVMFLASE